MGRGAWQATIHGVTESQTCLKRLGTAQHTAWSPDPAPANGGTCMSHAQTGVAFFLLQVFFFFFLPVVVVQVW